MVFYFKVKKDFNVGYEVLGRRGRGCVEGHHKFPLLGKAMDGSMITRGLIS